MPKPILFLLFFLCIIVNVHGQTQYGAIDKVSKSVPDSLTTPKEIAQYLTGKWAHPEHKVRALFIWITHNIRYDLKQVNNPKSYSSYEEMVQDIINSKQGICGHYSELFHHFCNAIGLESYVISGYTRELGEDLISDLNHAWNAVKIGNDFLLVDNTLAAGYTNAQDDYVHHFLDDHFLMAPDKLIHTHVPFDPIWQFLDNPLSHFDFEKRDFSKLEQPGNFSFKDSIQRYDTLDKLMQLQETLDRIERYGVTNKHIQQETEHIAEQIEIHKYNALQLELNQIIEKTNVAKDNINEAITYDNAFINYLNRRFKNPKVDDQTISTTMEQANHYFYEGKEQLKSCKEAIWRLDYGTLHADIRQLLESHEKELIDFIAKLETKMLDVEPSIIRNTAYSKKYLSTWKPFRFTVVY
nr:transglutaminase domain-containing protein [Allomuricauda sp.]